MSHNDISSPKGIVSETVWVGWRVVEGQNLKAIEDGSRPSNSEFFFLWFVSFFFRRKKKKEMNITKTVLYKTYLKNFAIAKYKHSSLSEERKIYYNNSPTAIVNFVELNNNSSFPKLGKAGMGSVRFVHIYSYIWYPQRMAVKKIPIFHFQFSINISPLTSCFKFLLMQKASNIKLLRTNVNKCNKLNPFWNSIICIYFIYM